MGSIIKLNYFYGDEPDKLCFYRIPKVLFTKKYFSGLSTDAKLLYGLMLDQMSLSRENRWLDKDNKVYIIYSIQRACAYLGCKKDKALKLFAELDCDTGIGLIERVKRGQGKADIIYVKSFELPEGAEDRPEIMQLKKVVDNSDRSEKPTSRNRKNRSQEVGKSDTNKNIKNNTKGNEINPVISCQPEFSHLAGTDGQDMKYKYTEFLKNQIQYSALTDPDSRFRNDKDKIDGIINIIADIAVTVPPDGMEWINSRPYPYEIVKSRLLKTDYDVIEHVLVNMRNNKTKIRNMRSYLLTALYNARDEMDMICLADYNYNENSK